MTVRLLHGDCLDRLRELPDESVHCCVTSPPYYGLRDYGVPGQLGLEPTLAEYLDNMVAVFREVRRVLRSDGTLWLNIGDSYNSIGHKKSGSGYGTTGLAGGIAQEHSPLGREAAVRDLKHKDLIGVPWRLAFALQADGWYLRSDIIWHKKSAMPESVRDRPTKSHEHIFLLAKSESYYYDQAAASEPVTQSTVDRCSQESWDEQEGSDRVPGKTNGTMKAVVKRGADEERSRRLAESANRRTGGLITGGTEASTLGISATHARNWRDVWSLGPEPFKEAHFATFPTEIPRRAILAGTSEKGCCPSCGAGWVREVEREFIPQRDVSVERGVRGYGEQKPLDSSDGRDGFPRGTTAMTTAGWVVACECPPADPVPATVLDPFLGSGTTALVADRLQRDCIGIELNPEYAAMAERRIRGDAPLFAEVA